jgi:hypothetical protein
MQILTFVRDRWDRPARVPDRGVPFWNTVFRHADIPRTVMQNETLPVTSAGEDGRSIRC